MTAEGPRQLPHRLPCPRRPLGAISATVACARSHRSLFACPRSLAASVSLQPGPLHPPWTPPCIPCTGLSRASGLQSSSVACSRPASSTDIPSVRACAPEHPAVRDAAHPRKSGVCRAQCPSGAARRCAIGTAHQVLLHRSACRLCLSPDHCVPSPTSCTPQLDSLAPP